jgi:PAS domain S-box-containing protein
VANSNPQALCDSETRFRELLDNVNLIAVTINTRTEITYCNEYFLQVTQWTLAEVQGRRWQDVFVPVWVADISGLLTDILNDSPRATHHENDLLTRSGERRSVRWNNIVLRDAANRIVGAAGIGEDITERRLLERQLLDSSERERRHLQSQLHDGLGQELFGIAILARSIATAAERDGVPLAAELSKLSMVASRAIETCRLVARGLSPLSDMHGGLVRALEELTIMPSDWRGPRMGFAAAVAAPLLLSGTALEQVYRIAQEAVTNAIKHASAVSIDVNLDVQTNLVSLEITADGIGLSRDVEPDAGVGVGVGLNIMRYRADIVHAQLRFEQRPHGGTRVVLICEQTG